MKDQKLESYIMEELPGRLAPALHDELWRKGYQEREGKDAQNWKPLKDPEGDMAYLASLGQEEVDRRAERNIYKKEDNGDWKVNINNDFDVLTPSWQEENKQAAKEATELVGRVRNGENLSLKEVGHILHEKWLSRNEWAKDDKVLGLPFQELPEVEKEKDLAQYRLALAVSAKLEEEYKMGPAAPVEVKEKKAAVSSGPRP